MELKEIIKQVVDSCNQKGTQDFNLIPSDECILEQAVKIYLTDIIKNGHQAKKNIVATEKQIKLLKNLKYKGTLELSKEEARLLKMELLEK